MTLAYHGWQTRDSNSKNFYCHYEDCDKVFYRKYHLLRHQRLKHYQPFAKDCHSSTANAVHGSSENISVSEPPNQPTQPEYSFPVESLGCPGNLEAAAQMHADCNDAGYGEKQQRKSSSLGDDVQVLSADDDWTENNERESSEPVAGCSQWAGYGEELQDDATVSMFRYRDLLCLHLSYRWDQWHFFGLPVSLCACVYVRRACILHACILGWRHSLTTMPSSSICSYITGIGVMV